MENLPTKKMSTGKKILIGVGGLVLLFIVIGIFSSSEKTDQKTTPGTPASENESTPKSSAEKKWTLVYSFKGNGDKKSPTIELTGNESRLKYSYKSNAGSLGAFSVYFLDDKVDLMKDGGFPEVMIDKSSDQGESSLHKGAGKYYLSISAMGDWEVSVEEMK